MGIKKIMSNKRRVEQIKGKPPFHPPILGVFQMIQQEIRTETQHGEKKKSQFVIGSKMR